MVDSEPADANNALVQAVGLYALGEVNEGRAAEIAGLTRWEMRFMLEDTGLELRHGPETADGARSDAGLPVVDESDLNEVVALAGEQSWNAEDGVLLS